MPPSFPSPIIEASSTMKMVLTWGLWLIFAIVGEPSELNDPEV